MATTLRIPESQKNFARASMTKVTRDKKRRRPVTPPTPRMTRTLYGAPYEGQITPPPSDLTAKTMGRHTSSASSDFAKQYIKRGGPIHV
jgi:hypothetical protein